MGTIDLQITRQNASLRILVEDKLRQAISSGRFKPGQRLVERELCELIGVGRTSVREALRQLEAEGLITSYPHRGPVVSTISYEEARQLYSVRALLESFAGQEFAENGSNEEIVALLETVEAFEAAAKSGSGTRIIEAKTAFYDCLMTGSKNVFVKQMLTSLHNRVTLLRMTSMTQPGRLQNSVFEIREIAAAIALRDGDRAAALCKRHIEIAAKVALDYLSKNPVETSE
ncbi:GntR family transcriptional regulator [Rhizobium sp. MC63]|uniref:DNA-binding GntR family transcriptional regulator n=6 Tax=Rhizobium TaxID=379 RepID=A0A7W6VF51_RHIET|nr:MULTISPECIES: GntR family transcriptional regulator [Rhizobium]KEC70738.1 GntR family transcriptional regulator [Rhizobium leguminosarum bv. phaseoli CCGM1]ANK88380.1 GntR family transcriptional regulator protein [Rhizobium sp. N731]ANL18627.1 GntR family transcriptional regulator protein [Rhizobium sp. N1314]ANL75169.1 GntR family transcriptional regulator protein [Rhizobium phaseoli]ARM91210.1 GntR family transcriptional regulator protein [Rhizobium sp. CIAT894]